MSLSETFARFIAQIDAEINFSVNPEISINAKKLYNKAEFPLYYKISYRRIPGNKKWEFSVETNHEPDNEEVFWLVIFCGQILARKRFGTTRLYRARVRRAIEGTEYDKEIPF